MCHISTQIVEMEARNTGVHACFFLWLKEREIFLPHLVKHVENVHLWVRYINVILMIWQESESNLVDFVNSFNHNMKYTELSFKYSHDSIEYLGILIHRCVPSN